MKYDHQRSPTINVAMAIQECEPASAVMIVDELEDKMRIIDIIQVITTLIAVGIVWTEWIEETGTHYYFITAEAYPMVQELREMYRERNRGWWRGVKWWWWIVKRLKRK